MGALTKRPLALADLAEIWSFIADGIEIVRVLHSARDITAEYFEAESNS
jgi:plasmid stabilization system protein ParE